MKDRHIKDITLRELRILMVIRFHREHFCLNDNNNKHSDSRTYGLIDKNIIGDVGLKYYHLKEFNYQFK